MRSRLLIVLVVSLFGLVAIPSLGQASGHDKTYVSCQNKGPKIKPSACTFYNRSNISGTYVRDLRWRKWGGKHAVGHGTLMGNMNFRSKVKIVLGGRDKCQVGPPYDVLIYTRITIDYKKKGFGTAHGGLTNCDGSPA